MRAAKMKAGCYQGGHARSGFACGGRVKRAEGGAVTGGDMAIGGGISKPRLDRAPRGDKGGSTVNVIVAPKPDAPAAPAMPMAGPPPMPQPIPPMMGPAGGAPAGMPPGMPMRARGGRVNKAHPDEAQDRALIRKMIAQEEKREGRAAGGRVPHMTAGAESGMGRLQKIGRRP